MSELIVRPTAADDLDAIADIYAHHVRTGVARSRSTLPMRRNGVGDSEP